MNIELKKDIVFNDLKESILSGKLKGGQKLKNELELSREMCVAKKTLRSALSRLEAEGLIARIPAKGTFVLDRTAKASRGNKRKFLIIADGQSEIHMPFNYIMPGIENKIAELNFDSMYCSFEHVLSLSPEEAEKSFKSSGIDGIIFCSNFLHGNERILQILNKTGLPGVIPHTHRIQDSAASGYAIQLFDEKGSFRAGLGHLSEMGHCRVASIMLKGFTPNYRGYSVDEYFDMLEEFGMDTDKTLFQTATYDVDEIKNVTAELMKQHMPPTAIMCFSDFYAIHVYDVLKKMSFRIPDDVAVMGYCGYPGGALLKPSLSTVDLQYFEIGKSAVELLACSDEWFNAKEKTAIPVLRTAYKLVTRESTAIKRFERKMMEVIS